MFEKFYKFVGVENQGSIDSPESFLKAFSGSSFKNGLYRIHDINDIAKWTKIVEDTFPKYKGNILVFGYDWLGRQFAQNSQTGKILLFEPGTGEVLNIPVDFVLFHDEEIAEYSEDSLASDFFEEWYESDGGGDIPHDKCVGYKVPLFLNGEDNISNLELSDIEVYWGIMGQMIAK